MALRTELAHLESEVTTRPFGCTLAAFVGLVVLGHLADQPPRERRIGVILSLVTRSYGPVTLR
jgi:hypothetical protein